MAISRVQFGGTQAADTSSISIATGSNVTAGNLLVVYGMKYSPSDTDILVIGDLTKTAGTATLGTITLDVDHFYDHGTDGVMAAVYSVPITGSGSLTLQITSDSGSYLAIAYEEVSGADTSGTRLEATNEATGNSVSPDSGNCTAAGGAIFCGCAATYAIAGHTWTQDGAFTQIYEQETIDHVTAAAASRIVTTGTTDSASWTISTGYNWVAVCAVYKEASGGGPAPPTVTTQAVSSIGTTTATGNGTVTSDGGDTVTERGVVANTTGTPTTTDLKFTAASGGTGSYTASMTGLTPAEHYYVRAYAINSEGTAYGSEVEFDTDAEPATLTQTAVRIYADDDTEGEATPLAAENTAATATVNVPFRVRAQVDATNDPASLPYSWQARMWNADLEEWGEWTAVPAQQPDDAMLLSVSGVNARYLVNTAGEPVVLAGFHTWNNVQNSSASPPAAEFDWDEYLTALTSRGLNFTKLWTYESPRGWGRYRGIMRYERSGTSGAADGGNKFDLTALNQAWIDRLRARAEACKTAGLWCCVQLFQGWDAEDKGIENSWTYHPFASVNNINSVSGDTNTDGSGTETRRLASNPVLSYQEAEVTAVVTALNDLDNIIYEISNEDTGHSENTAWQEYWMDFIRDLEAGMALQHLVGMTVQYPSGSNATLTGSSADWVSYSNRDGVDGTKVSMSDTDHIEGLTDTYQWIWISFCNGHGGLWYMDSWDGGGYDADTRANSTYILIRDNLSYAVDLIGLLNNIEAMTPQAGLSTSGYCLARNHATAGEYVAFYDGSGTFNLNLSTATGTLQVRWLRCSTGATSTSTVSGGDVRTMTPPWTGAVVLYVHHE